MTGRVCRVCVMTETEDGVVIGPDGQCNCCRDALARKPQEWWPDAVGEAKMSALVTRLKAEGAGRPYDAMVGLSGGIDSAWLAHRMATQGLRLLAIHVDAGWNSEAAVHNIEKLVRALDLDLHTQVIEWDEVRDVQLAFLRAGVMNQDFPQDHAFFATLTRLARRFGVRSFLTGVNFASEGLYVPHHDDNRYTSPSSTDGSHLRAIHRAFGERPLVSFPVMTMTEYLWMTQVRRTPRRYRPLDYFNYDKEEARRELTEVYGWRDYGPKHSESRFTKFFQEVYLPGKFGLDKRRLHLSSLIISGQMTRDAALEALEQPVISPAAARRDLVFVAKKLGVTPETLQGFIDAPPRSHFEFASANRMTTALLRARSVVRGVFRPAR